MDKQRLDDLQYRNFYPKEKAGISALKAFLLMMTIWALAIMVFSLPY